ncbi:hypothetical protein ASPZODRAFT_145309 [Penicilliopsis zonata CBS 506.65]|uniref:Protein PNS1 n=1 Tax=Penicilliopsis zonata CBS 506.65 TaxID=1073090 RepID=A0A1L9SAM0_9EURO|nr:hypothetical protein ASPZODRAFT_145309 [Penicilliopsis zonata CBS 506.65]OJJ44198.1 hypothetical protein ASPZODRAFT_145309 [Penicilliopsis zonata CBS 506.65]
MFSEYASRFLAQSQSRLALPSEEHFRSGQTRSNRGQGNFRNGPSRSYFQRTIGDPYQNAASQISNNPFASRISAQPAPLFYSATDEFREEDDETEREREIADFYALQRSRRHFGGSQLEESSEVEDDRGGFVPSGSQMFHDKGIEEGKGIRSSWRGDTATHRTRDARIPPISETSSNGDETHLQQRDIGRYSGQLIEVGLKDSYRSDDTDIQRADSPGFSETNPPSVQRLRDPPIILEEHHSTESSLSHPEGDEQTLFRNLPLGSSQGSSSLNMMTRPDPPAHDAFWSHLFFIALAGLFASSFLVYLNTSTPSQDKSRWGDTVYMTLHKSFFLLGIYTLVSIILSLLWLTLLRFYARPLVYAMIISVPVILYSFSLYPFISSFKGSWHGSSIQDRVMRLASAVPFVMASLWIINTIRGRHAIGKAVGILQFSCRILAANPELLTFSLATLVSIVAWTWVWLLMFTRVFLGGHMASSASFVINRGSWLLGTYFILIYMWSLGIIAGIQRAVTAAAVSQWYFHRFVKPAPTSRQIVRAAIVHAVTTLFGTICLSRLLGLLVRLPLLLLPSRTSSAIGLFFYSFVPTPIAVLTNPLTLTYAAIHSQSLSVSARGISQMTILAPSIDTISLNPRSFSRQRDSVSSLYSYRLSKLLLHATRLMMSLALGFGGWVTTARNLNSSVVNGVTIRGSLYAYIVGLIAGAIGWSVLGAMESVIADIVDASVICWSSDIGSYGGEARYCREAGLLFSEE